MKHFFKHIGYYNNVGDIKILIDKNADFIIDYYKKGFGAFYFASIHEEENDFCLEDEFADGNPSPYFMRDSSGDYVILNQGRTWKEWKEKYKDFGDKEDSDCYIDIYYLYKIEDNGVGFYRD